MHIKRASSNSLGVKVIILPEWVICMLKKMAGKFKYMLCLIIPTTHIYSWLEKNPIPNDTHTYSWLKKNPPLSKKNGVCKCDFVRGVLFFKSGGKSLGRCLSMYYKRKVVGWRLLKLTFLLDRAINHSHTCLLICTIGIQRK